VLEINTSTVDATNYRPFKLTQIARSLQYSGQHFVQVNIIGYEAVSLRISYMFRPQKYICAFHIDVFESQQNFYAFRIFVLIRSISAHFMYVCVKCHSQNQKRKVALGAEMQTAVLL
jgi:hypothetical protein